MGIPGGSVVKNPLANAGDSVDSLCAIELGVTESDTTEQLTHLRKDGGGNCRLKET